MKFQVRRSKFGGNYPKNLKLPYYIDVMLKNRLIDLDPIKETIFFDIEELEGIYSVYVDLSQFKKGNEYLCHYIVFKQSFHTINIDDKSFDVWSDKFIYLDSNAIDKNKNKDLKPYHNIDFNKI